LRAVVAGGGEDAAVAEGEGEGMNRLSGAWFKLVDERGVHIGVLMVPEDVALQFEKNHEYYVGCYRRSKMLTGMLSVTSEPMNSQSASLGRFLVKRCYHLDHHDALSLEMITPEEVSTEPGFAFLPNAEYLRILVAEKAVGHKPVASGEHLQVAR
jgi:hypothetical protein